MSSPSPSTVRGSHGKEAGVRSRRGLDWLLVIGAMVVVALAVWAQTAAYYQRVLAARQYWYEPSNEARDLSERYGPKRYSRDFEEWIIRDAFQDRHGGVFLDVGANHYRDESNTYYLETVLGWSGLAVEAQPEFGADYALHRPRTKFVAMFASDVPGRQVAFFVPQGDASKLVASASESVATANGSTATRTDVPTTTLNVVLEQAAVERVDFLTMDIELSEPAALKGFDIERYKPSLVCVEAHLQVRQEILDYFLHHNYVVVGKYLRVDVKNLYFRPKT